MRPIKHCALPVAACALAAASILTPAAARGQIFVTNWQNSTVGAYGLDGTPINPSLISGLNAPTGIAVSGSDIFVVNGGSGADGYVSEYTTAGEIVNQYLIVGLSDPQGIAVSGSDIYVANGACGEIGQYTLGAPGLITSSNPTLISGIGYPRGIAVSGSNLFVADSPANAINEYDITGTPLATPLVTGLQFPWGVAASGNDLYVANYAGNGPVGDYTLGADPGTLASSNPSLFLGSDYQQGIAALGSDLFVTNWNSGTIGEYTTSGDTVNASLVANIPGVSGIAVADDNTDPAAPPVPEPASAAIFLVAATALLMRRPRKQLA